MTPERDRHGTCKVTLEHSSIFDKSALESAGNSVTENTVACTTSFTSQDGAKQACMAEFNRVAGAFALEPTALVKAVANEFQGQMMSRVDVVRNGSDDVIDVGMVSVLVLANNVTKTCCPALKAQLHSLR